LILGTLLHSTLFKYMEHALESYVDDCLLAH
jgi:hypothetical protein